MEYSFIILGILCVVFLILSALGIRFSSSSIGSIPRILDVFGIGRKSSSYELEGFTEALPFNCSFFFKLVIQGSFLCWSCWYGIDWNLVNVCGVLLVMTYFSKFFGDFEKWDEVICSPNILIWSNTAEERPHQNDGIASSSWVLCSMSYECSA